MQARVRVGSFSFAASCALSLVVATAVGCATGTGVGELGAEGATHGRGTGADGGASGAESGSVEGATDASSASNGGDDAAVTTSGDDAATSTSVGDDAATSADTTSPDTASEPPDTYVPPTDTGGVATEGGCTSVTHDDGLGDSFGFCAPLATPGAAGTYSEALAMAAAQAWSPGSTPMPTTCSGTHGTCTGVDVIKGGVCARWCYGGSAAGHVWQAKTATCTCPYTTDPSWK